MTAPSAGRPILEAHGLHKHFGALHVLKGVDLVVAERELVFIIGPSGSGKSTLLRCLNRLEDPSSGTVVVDGIDMLDRRTDINHARQRIGMVFQAFNLYPHMTALGNVTLALRKVAGKGRAEAEAIGRAALARVGLADRADHTPGQLSGGQQQRVAIARAIVFHPSIVLMDEPLGALDKNLRYEMQVEIKDIQRRLGMTVVYVTHDQEEAMNMSDRIAIMNHGRIEQLGSPDLIYERPSNAFVGKFLGQANLIEGTIESIADGEAVLRTRDGAALRARLDRVATPGRAASLFARPEKLAFGDGGDGNRVTGTVRRRCFLGSMIRTVIEVGPATQLTVDVANLGDGGGPEIGAAVTVHWPVAHSIMLLD